jgi:phosphate transport system substrate-binding protein
MKTVVSVALIVGTLSTGIAHADQIKVEGGGTSISTVFLPIQKGFEKYHGDTLNIVQSTAVKGLIALDAGRVDIASGAHPLQDLIAGAAKSGVIIDPAKFVVTKMEENTLVVITNRANPIRKLSKEQLKGIFTGKIANWKDIGGSDLPIKVVWGRETEGQNIQFTRLALDSEPVTSKTTQATSYRNISDTVAGTEGSIGVVPLQIATPATRSMDTVSLSSPMYIITKGTPSKKVQAVIDFYRKEYTLD